MYVVEYSDVYAFIFPRFNEDARARTYQLYSLTKSRQKKLFPFFLQPVHRMKKRNKNHSSLTQYVNEMQYLNHIMLLTSMTNLCRRTARNKMIFYRDISQKKSRHITHHFERPSYTIHWIHYKQSIIACHSYSCLDEYFVHD